MDTDLKIGIAGYGVVGKIRRKIIDSIPSILDSLRAKILLLIVNISLIAYSGLVPISPKTTPSAARDNAIIDAFFAFIWFIYDSLSWLIFVIFASALPS